MARKNFNSPKPDYYVTIGGRSKEGVANPTKVEGYYLGSASGTSPFDENKTETKFMLRDAEGKVMGINGNANLIFQFKDAEDNLKAQGLNIHGMQTFIEFVGERKAAKKGRSPTKLFKIEFDPDDVIDVTVISSAAPEGSDETSDTGDDSLDEAPEADDLGEADNEPPEALTSSATQLSAAERKAKADEIKRRAAARK